LEVSDTSTPGRLANISGALVLGGRSSRMGTDKAQLEQGGVAYSALLSGLLAAIFEEVLLVGGAPAPEARGRRVVDRPGTACALRGLVTALHEASSERVLVLATDLPLVTPDLILALTAWPDHAAVVPRTEGRTHPLCALYRRESVLEIAQRRLAEGALQLEGLLDAVETSFLEGPDLRVVDPDGLALTNVNTPADYERLNSRV
jgi:molybdopterin-guanine dinucleotide biosynthesis protein A